jgi:hypothetical protein
MNWMDLVYLACVKREDFASGSAIWMWTAKSAFGKSVHTYDRVCVPELSLY